MKNEGRHEGMLGTTAFVLGVLSIIFGVISPFAGIVVGIVGIFFSRSAQKNGSLIEGRRALKLCIIGIIVGIVVMVASYLMFSYIQNNTQLLQQISGGLG